jgi:transcriptional regulator with XRE-family HTH domain
LQHRAEPCLLLFKTDAPSSGGGQLPLQLLHVPAQGLDGLHKRLVCHSLAPPGTWTVHSRAGCRFICSAVRKPSSLGAKNPEPPVIAYRPDPTSDKRRQAAILAGGESELTMEPIEPVALTPLQAARLDKRWKAARLAAELGVSETTLSRWENGRQQPTLRHQQRLCEVLDMDPVELGFKGDILQVGTRREFIRQVTALVGTATMEAVLEVGGPDALDRFSLAVGRPTRVDRATVQHLETVTATHRQLYHHLSSFELVDAVTGHLRGVTRLLRGAQHRVLRRRLAAVAGETAGHAAWLFHDLGDQKLTERYYADAAIATRKAGDPALDAYVSGFKSLVRASQGEPTAALALARAARQAGARSAAATTRSWLAGLEAQALATLHESKACFVALH